mgnify:CR=1 FL=1
MVTEPIIEAADSRAQTLTCVLFLAAGSPSSERARAIVAQALCNAGFGTDALETVDVQEDRARALRAGAIVVPMVSVATPTEHRWYAGNFEDMPDLDAFFHSLR